jgi:NUMOD4 motif
MKEIWKDIDDYRNIYQVSNLGRIKSLARTWISGKGVIKSSKDRILVTAPDSNGYYIVNLHKYGIRTCFKLHRLVAKYFIPNPENKPEVNHKRGNKSHNKASQLEWVTKSENELHAWKTKLKIHSKGEKHHMTSLTKKEVFMIRYLRNKNNSKHKDLANCFNTTVATIHNIIKRKTWQ